MSKKKWVRRGAIAVMLAVIGAIVAYNRKEPSAPVWQRAEEPAS